MAKNTNTSSISPKDGISSSSISGDMLLPVNKQLVDLISLKCDHQLQKAECLFFVIAKCMSCTSSEESAEKSFTTSCRELGRIWQKNHETVLSFLKKLEALEIIHLSSPSAKQLKITLDKGLY